LIVSFDYQTFALDWEGIALSVTFCPDWSASYREIYGSPMAHLEIRSIDGQPLPVTETGYRSHFINAELIDAEGGAAAFVRAWLDHEARSPQWKAAKAKQQQLSLF
jgi:hypothetical protein